jgi:putative hydrolase of the HAD superfamily
MTNLCRAVLFDYFGTLSCAVRRGPIHRLMAQRLGCDPDAWLDLLNQTFYERATGRLGPPIEVLRWLAASLGASPGREELEEVCAARVDVIGADGPLRPDAVPVLRALRASGLRTAIVSDCWYELPRLMPRLPVYPLVDAHVYSVEVGHCKPHPDMYLTACERLGVAPEECLYVGDGGSRELTGAAAIGISAVRLAEADLGGHLTFNADVGWDNPSIPSLREVLPLVAAPLVASELVASAPAPA